MLRFISFGFIHFSPHWYLIASGFWWDTDRLHVLFIYYCIWAIYAHFGSFDYYLYACRLFLCLSVWDDFDSFFSAAVWYHAAADLIIRATQYCFYGKKISYFHLMRSPYLISAGIFLLIARTSLMPAYADCFRRRPSQIILYDVTMPHHFLIRLRLITSISLRSMRFKWDLMPLCDLAFYHLYILLGRCFSFIGLCRETHYTRFITRSSYCWFLALREWWRALLIWYLFHISVIS